MTRQDPRWYVALGLLVLLLVAGLALAAVAVAQTPSPNFCGFGRVQTPRTAWIQSGAAYQQLSLSSQTTASSPTIPVLSQGGPIVGAVVEIQSGLVNIRVDGTAATGSTDAGGSTYGPGGTSVVTATAVVVCGTDLKNLSLIRSSQTATNPLVNIRYYVPGT